jgi:hypothetical protein
MIALTSSTLSSSSDTKYDKAMVEVCSSAVIAVLGCSFSVYSFIQSVTLGSSDRTGSDTYQPRPLAIE